VNLADHPNPNLSKRSPNVPIVEDITPLHLAATAGWIDGINALLDKAAFINPRDEFLRETPLHKAVRNLEKVAIKVLCARGTYEYLRNLDGLDYRGLLECAEQYPDKSRVGNAWVLIAPTINYENSWSSVFVALAALAIKVHSRPVETLRSYL